MERICRIIAGGEQFKQVQKGLLAGKAQGVVGLSPLPCAVFAGELAGTYQQALLVTAGESAAAEFYENLRALYPGQSDVLVLPFSQKTLLARVRPLLSDREPIPELTVLEGERVALLDGQRVELTAQEFALLLALLESPDTPISREELLRKAWGYQSMGETRTVDVHVQRLRRKLGMDRIETVYKCGYRLITA